MNKLLFVCAVGALAFAACERTPQVEGTWIGAPMRTDGTTSQSVLGPAVDCTVASNLIFTPDNDDAKSGSINITSDINLLDAVNAPVESPIDTYEISVSATASIQGTYTFTDHDDIAVTLDYSTLTVHLDPNAVTYNQNLIDGRQIPELDSLRTSLADKYRASISQQLRTEYAKYQHIDDVKIKHSILSCEVADRDLSFRRAE